MLLPLNELIKKHNLKIKGIIHCGASHGEEFAMYQMCGITNQIWIEALPEIAEKCKENIKSNPNAKTFTACLHEETGIETSFYETDNDGQSSSYLPLKLHKEVHSNVNVKTIRKFHTITLSDLMKANCVNLSQYNMLNMDLQGVELFVLKGFEAELENIDYIYTEVNTKELYENCGLLPELQAFLAKHNFIMIDIKMNMECFWGDALFIKQK